MDLGIAGRRAAIAAASNGLGLASAKALADERVRVAICGRDQQRIAVACDTVGHDAVGLVCDVATPDGATQFVVEPTEALGGLDIVVTNTGGPPTGNSAQTEPGAYAPALELNLMSVVAMCRAAFPAMQAQRWGRVVAITSFAVRQPMGNLIL